MEYLNVLQFIKQYEQDEDAQRVDELNEMEADEIARACNSSFNYVNLMEV